MNSPSIEIRRHLRLALQCMLLAVGAGSAWSGLVPLDAAVVTSGSVVVESNIKKVQHPTGGIVGEILVKEGQAVENGQVVVRLDETVTRANLGIVVNELMAVHARIARLTAERDQEPTLTFPPELVARALTFSDVDQIVNGELRLFASRRETREGQRAQLVERAGQLKKEIGGLTEQLTASKALFSISSNDLVDLAGLKAKGLVQRTRIAQLEREIAQTRGQVGDLTARIASAHGKVAEINLQISQLDKDHQSEVNKDLREATTKLGELQERRVAAEDQLKRVEIKAPIAGTVHQLAVHTVGGVIPQTEPLMMIVPDAERLVIEVKIAPQDRDQVRVGQPARMRFTAFNQRVTPEVWGTLLRVAADLTKEPQTNTAYYTAAIAIDEDQLKRLKGLKILPGMPVDAFIRTGSRTFASYIAKPISDQMERAFRER